MLHCQVSVLHSISVVYYRPCYINHICGTKSSTVKVRCLQFDMVLLLVSARLATYIGSKGIVSMFPGQRCNQLYFGTTGWLCLELDCTTSTMLLHTLGAYKLLWVLKITYQLRYVTSKHVMNYEFNFNNIIL